MSQRSITGPDPTGWLCTGDPPWRVVFPAFLQPAGIIALREDLISGALRAGDEAFTLLHGGATSPAPVVCRAVDRHADLLYDLARAPEVVALAEFLVGKAVVPLGGDYVLLPQDRPPGAWRQCHADFVEHFGDERAALVWLPLRHDDASSGQVEFAPYAGRRLEASDPVGTPGLSRALHDQERSPEACVPVQVGGCLGFDSYACWRFGEHRGSHLAEGVLLSYRGSPYREARRA